MMRKPAVFARMVQATNAPKEGITKSHEPRVGDTHSQKGPHVEVTADEVDIVLHHVSMKPMQERSRCVAFLSNFVVNVD